MRCASDTNAISRCTPDIGQLQKLRDLPILLSTFTRFVFPTTMMHALLFFLIPLLVRAVSPDISALEAQFPPCIVSVLNYANVLNTREISSNTVPRSLVSARLLPMPVAKAYMTGNVLVKYLSALKHMRILDATPQMSHVTLTKL